VQLAALYRLIALFGWDDPRDSAGYAVAYAVAEDNLRSRLTVAFVARQRA
jgi:hypothetical protein